MYSGFSISLMSYKLLLPGTPVQNDLQEFYSIIEFVNPGILGTSAAYRKIYEEPILRSRQPTCTEVTSLLEAHINNDFYSVVRDNCVFAF